MLPAWVWPVLDVWAVSRSPSPLGGMIRHLPCSGGAGEQPAALMDALGIIDSMMDARRAPS